MSKTEAIHYLENSDIFHEAMDEAKGADMRGLEEFGQAYLMFPERSAVRRHSDVSSGIPWHKFTGVSGHFGEMFFARGVGGTTAMFSEIVRNDTVSHGLDKPISEREVDGATKIEKSPQEAEPSVPLSVLVKKGALFFFLLSIFALLFWLLGDMFILTPGAAILISIVSPLFYLMGIQIRKKFQNDS